ncbi:hypothetical protein GCM10007421_06630 [Halopseudomonas oceani]|uniref:Uncharacterized protein n=1 Tax=Halopseudomonas oceani TaxID=1708783 RepID=A0A2P4F084_9GAMM|nr:hypothetical protein [Halopseudomonas oceani]POB06422.1 hypothetical protein C1949_01410 [Halopseudomonas oceani]GGE35500.1 hypothetical protein GCM10007421_06630 [Halopseudomonas oceani]
MTLRFGTALLVCAVTLSAEAMADQPTYVLMTGLSDGYYGYSNRTPEQYRFIAVSNGVPTLYMPAGSACSSNTLYFKQSERGDIWVHEGSPNRMGSPYSQNKASLRADALLARPDKVTTANHLACQGAVQRGNG